MAEATLKRARELACRHYYGPESQNRGCCSAACKNAEYGGKEWACELCELQESIATALEAWAQEARDKVAAWMIEHSFATGHGDTLDDLLKELSWQVKLM